MIENNNTFEVGKLICKTQDIKGLTFKLTCGGFPEQYDVFKGSKQVAYVRLRHGWLYVSDPSMDNIWWETDDCEDTDYLLCGDGNFETPEERYYFLNKISECKITPYNTT